MSKKRTDKDGKLQFGRKLAIAVGFAAILCLMVVIVVVNISNLRDGADNSIEGIRVDQKQTEAEREESSSTEADSQVNNSGELDEKTEAKAFADDSGITKISEGESFQIPISEVTADAGFYPIEVDGTVLEIIAVKDSEGNIRTAFNTCQVCYDSGRGYYKQEGDYLVCQNCGNGFTMDEVETESGGCNPWPIFAENKLVNENTIEISYDFLSQSREIFANWRNDY